MGREAKASHRLRTEAGGGDLTGFGVGRITAHRRKRLEKRDQLFLSTAQTKGLTSKQIAQLMVLMRRVRDEYRDGKRTRELVEFELNFDGDIVEAGRHDDDDAGEAEAEHHR